MSFCGPLEWARHIGLGVCAALLEALNDAVDDDRFAAAPLLAAGG